ncbi:MAG TPA: hypothetical protein VJS67_05720 [Pseudonocardiaceae bacterium]|nr:hypothetical protein [Pseudonocardiaceae bacterium]
MDNETSYGIDMFVEMQMLLLQQRSRGLVWLYESHPVVWSAN